MNLSRWIIYFTITSFLGYVYETIAMTLWGGKWENRGFLFGPIIPIYGAGASIGSILIYAFLKDINYINIFIIGTIASAVLEYPTHYLMEKLFNQKWWDYSNAPLNLNGRISLFSSLGFGLGAVIIVFILNPILLPFIKGLSDTFVEVAAIILTVLITADTATTVAYISDFEDQMAYFEEIIDKKISDKVENVLEEDKAIKGYFYNAVDKAEENKIKIKEKLSNVKERSEEDVEKVLSHAGSFHKKTVKRFIKFKQAKLGKSKKK